MRRSSLVGGLWLQLLWSGLTSAAFVVAPMPSLSAHAQVLHGGPLLPYRPRPHASVVRLSDSAGPDELILREKYRQEKEARERMLLSARRAEMEEEALPVHDARDFVDYGEKDRSFRIRNGMIDPSADSEWVDEALLQPEVSAFEHEAPP